jgi:hypothetical protein
MKKTATKIRDVKRFCINLSTMSKHAGLEEVLEDLKEKNK